MWRDFAPGRLNHRRHHPHLTSTNQTAQKDVGNIYRCFPRSRQGMTTEYDRKKPTKRKEKGGRRRESRGVIIGGSEAATKLRIPRDWTPTKSELSAERWTPGTKSPLKRALKDPNFYKSTINLNRHANENFDLKLKVVARNSPEALRASKASKT